MLNLQAKPGTATAFVPPLSPLSSLRRTQSTSLTPWRSLPTAAPRRQRLSFPRCAQNSRPTPASQSANLDALRSALVDACTVPGLDRGLSADFDAEDESDAEGVVEDLAERLEDIGGDTPATTSPLMSGSWELLYTSSTLTRFHGGLSGLQKYVDGEVGRITQVIDTESGVCNFYEQIAYDLPVVGKPAEVTVVVNGKIRAVNETRQMWTPETIKASWFKLWAESWKSVRAFTIAETTYLDKELRITRGQTGSLTIYGRTQPGK